MLEPNYWELSQALLAKVHEENIQRGRKAKLAIHGCCAPCSCYPLEALHPYFEITIVYSNSNIYPREEYDIRLNELIKYVDTFNAANDANVQIEIPPYDNAAYMQLIKERAHDRECGATCLKCYELRMRDAFMYAKEHHFDYAGTVMSISRQKNSKRINEIGLRLEEEFQIPFLIADFKKKGGQVRRDELSKDMYRQQYCGCVFSYREYLERVKARDEECAK